MIIWIEIDDGDIFEGTLEQFRSCFFSNADEESIRDWCNDNGMKCLIIKNEDTCDGWLA